MAQPAPPLWAFALLSLAALMVPVGCRKAEPVVMIGPASVMIPELPDACGAVALASLVGAPFTQLADADLAGPLRVLRPGEEVSSDLQPLRLNAQVSDTARIQRLFCG